MSKIKRFMDLYMEISETDFIKNKLVSDTLDAAYDAIMDMTENCKTALNAIDISLNKLKGIDND